MFKRKIKLFHYRRLKYILEYNKLTHVNGLISTEEEHYEKLFWMMCLASHPVLTLLCLS